jgi:hypothetical protein
MAHGIIAALAFVVFFPGGAICIRLIPKKAAFWIHVTFEMIAFALYIAAFGMGVFLTQEFAEVQTVSVCITIQAWLMCRSNNHM